MSNWNIASLLEFPIHVHSNLYCLTHDSNVIICMNLVDWLILKLRKALGYLHLKWFERLYMSTKCYWIDIWLTTGRSYLCMGGWERMRLLRGRWLCRLNFSDSESDSIEEDDGPEFDALGGAAAVTEGVGHRELAEHAKSLEREPSLEKVTYVQMDQERSARSSLARNAGSGRLSGKFSRRSSGQFSGQLSGKFSRRPSGQFSGKFSGRSAGVNKEGAEENKGGQLTVKEDRVEGQVTWATYLKYAKDSGG